MPPLKISGKDHELDDYEIKLWCVVGGKNVTLELSNYATGVLLEAEFGERFHLPNCPCGLILEQDSGLVFLGFDYPDVFVSHQLPDNYKREIEWAKKQNQKIEMY